MTTLCIILSCMHLSNFPLEMTSTLKSLFPAIFFSLNASILLPSALPSFSTSNVSSSE